MLDLTKMQQTQEAYMSETVYIQSRTRTSDGAGGWSESWSTLATTRGRIGLLSWQPSEEEIAGRVQNRQKYIVTLPAGTELTEQNRLQINGRQFEIVGIARRSEATAIRVTCVEV